MRNRWSDNTGVPSNGTAGATLLTTLTFIGLGLILILVLVSTSFSQIHKSKNLTHSLRASRTAESVLALAIAKLIDQPDFDTSETNFVDWSDGQSHGWLSFDADQAEDWGIPPSISNREGLSAVDGWEGIRLPARAVHLVAVGESAGRRKTVDVVLHVPEFPYAVASSGPIESEGGLLIGSFLGDIATATDADLEDLGPADMCSNATLEAVKLEGEVEILGDITAVGTVSLGDDVVVHGTVEPGSDPVELSSIDVSSLRPDFSTPLEPTGGHMRVTGPMHYNDPDLHLARGLEMDSGVLFVNGDLTISGGITGQGALLVNGNVTIEGGALLSADNELAIVAAGDVTVDGDGETSYFQGLIYSEGDLVAQDITLLGSFIANGSETSIGSKVELSNARVVHKPSSASFDFPDERFCWLYGDTSTGNGTLYELKLSGENFELLRGLVADQRPADPEWQNALNSIAENSIMKTTPASNWVAIDPNDDNWNVCSPAQLAATLPSHLGGGGFRAFHDGGGVPQEKVVKYGDKTVGFTFDLNEFLSPENRMRVVHWRER